MDLISREALVDLAKSERKTCGKDYDFDGLLSDIENAPTIPAVPVDKLCEWLAHYVNPCKMGTRCYYPDDNDSDCMPSKECWRYVLTKWMEGQDATN